MQALAVAALALGRRVTRDEDEVTGLLHPVADLAAVYRQQARLAGSVPAGAEHDLIEGVAGELIGPLPGSAR